MYVCHRASRSQLRRGQYYYHPWLLAQSLSIHQNSRGSSRGRKTSLDAKSKHRVPLGNHFSPVSCPSFSCLCRRNAMAFIPRARPQSRDNMFHHLTSSQPGFCKVKGEEKPELWPAWWCGGVVVLGRVRSGAKRDGGSRTTTASSGWCFFRVFVAR